MGNSARLPLRALFGPQKPFFSPLFILNRVFIIILTIIVRFVPSEFSRFPVYFGFRGVRKGHCGLTGLTSPSEPFSGPKIRFSPILIKNCAFINILTHCYVCVTSSFH